MVSHSFSQSAITSKVSSTFSLIYILIYMCGSISFKQSFIFVLENKGPIIPIIIDFTPNNNLRPYIILPYIENYY